MDRRDFIKKSAAAFALAGLPASLAAAWPTRESGSA